MQIGGFFVITLLAACYATIKKNGYLKMALFFASFCECCVIYTQSFYLSPGHLFVFLALVAIVLVSIKTNKKIYFPNAYLGMFVFISLLSILFSWVFHIDVQVFGVGTGHSMKSSLVSLQNFTQLLYVIVGYLFSVMIVNHSIRQQNWNNCVKLTIVSSTFVLLIGVYQLIANRFGLPFVTIFKNPYKVQWQTQLRAQATMGEASFLGQYCAIISAIYFAPDYRKSRNKLYIIAYIALLLFVSLMTYSSTFLFGVATVFLTYGLIEKKTRRNTIKWIILFLGAVIAFIVLYSTNSKVQTLVNNAINKLSMENYSGIERLEIFQHMMNVGLKYPVLGIGFGGGRSRDLYSNLFSTTGILGLATFLAFIIKDVKILTKNINVVGARMCLCIIITYMVTAISMPDISYLTFWLFIGIVEAKCKQIQIGKNDPIQALSSCEQISLIQIRNSAYRLRGQEGPHNSFVNESKWS